MKYRNHSPFRYQLFALCILCGLACECVCQWFIAASTNEPDQWSRQPCQLPNISQSLTCRKISSPKHSGKTPRRQHRANIAKKFFFFYCGGASAREEPNQPTAIHRVDRIRLLLLLLLVVSGALWYLIIMFNRHGVIHVLVHSVYS